MGALEIVHSSSVDDLLTAHPAYDLRFERVRLQPVPTSLTPPHPMTWTSAPRDSASSAVRGRSSSREREERDYQRCIGAQAGMPRTRLALRRAYILDISLRTTPCETWEACFPVNKL